MSKRKIDLEAISRNQSISENDIKLVCKRLSEGIYNYGAPDRAEYEALVEILEEHNIYVTEEQRLKSEAWLKKQAHKRNAPDSIKHFKDCEKIEFVLRGFYAIIIGHLVRYVPTYVARDAYRPYEGAVEYCVAGQGQPIAVLTEW